MIRACSKCSEHSCSCSRTHKRTQLLARVITNTSKYQHIIPTLKKTTLASNQTKNRVQTLSSSQSVPLLAILASSLTLTCLSLIKSTLISKSCHFHIRDIRRIRHLLPLYRHSSCKFTCLHQTWLLQFTLLWHLTNKSQQTSTHSKFISLIVNLYFTNLT